MIARALSLLVLAYALGFDQPGHGDSVMQVVGLVVVEPLYAFWTQGRLPFDRALFAWLVAGVLVRTLASPWQSYLMALNQLPAQFTASTVRAAVTVGGSAREGSARSSPGCTSQRARCRAPRRGRASTPPRPGSWCRSPTGRS